MVCSLMGNGRARAKAAIVSKGRPRANLRGAQRAILARKQPHQLFHFTGGIDALAAPALRVRAVGERQGPAMPHFEIHAHGGLPRALDLPATDEGARRRDEVGAANEEPQAALADVHDLSFQSHPGAGGNRAVHGQIRPRRRPRMRALLAAHGDLGEPHADRARPLLGDERRTGGGELDMHPAELGDEGHLLALEQRRDRTPARQRLDDDVLSHRVDQAQLPPRIGAACEERRERLASRHERAQHALDLVARSGHEARGKGDCARVGGAHCGSFQPRPMNGILVAMMVMNCTLVSSGMFAMCSTAAPTRSTSISGSGLISPFACGTPSAIRAASGVRALPMSIWPQAMSYFLPSSALDLVSPVTACLVEVYGAEFGRGACAEIEPLLMMRPPRGLWLFMILNASCVHRNMPVRLVFTTACHCSRVRSSSMILPGVPIPALLKSTSKRPNFSFAAANSACTAFWSVTSIGTTSARSPAPSFAVSSRSSLRLPASATR